MAKPMKTPGVYIVEKSAFPNSVVEVATAVPAFIGYTEKALNKDKSLLNIPRQVTSMTEFHNYFGYAPPISFKIEKVNTNVSKAWAIAATAAAAAERAAKSKNAEDKVAAAAAAAAAAQLAGKAAGNANAAAAAAKAAQPDPEKVTAAQTAATDAATKATAAAATAATNATTAATDAGAASAAAKDAAGGDAGKIDDAVTKAKAASDSAKLAAESAKESADTARSAADKVPDTSGGDELIARAASLAADAEEMAKAAAVAADANKAAADESADDAKAAGEAVKTATAKATTPEGDPALRQNGSAYYLKRTSREYNLYWSMRLFYQNGGGPCFVVSVGDYDGAPEAAKLKAGIKTLIKEQEPTMVVIPDAVLLSVDDCIGVQQQSMSHCREMQSRISILDVYDGYKDRQDDPDCIDQFRDKLGVNDLDYATAYYPWIETTVVQDGDLGITSFDQSSVSSLKEIVETDLKAKGLPKLKLEELTKDLKDDLWQDNEHKSEDQIAKETLLHKSLVAMSESYKGMLQSIRTTANLMPPSAAMAGVYTMVDNTRGVWKAPANVSLNGVIRPSVNISHDDQEDLNVNAQGKSVNAIRSFVGEGTLVWGARTLDGNSLDWRYINVRRTLIMLEQSMKLAAKAYVFEANDANTWITMKSMARNFLTGIWKRGGLAGASPDDAFSVHVGLGETMTPEDILEGILRITILVAPVRPAEFIEITFQQQMQKS